MRLLVSVASRLRRHHGHWQLACATVSAAADGGGGGAARRRYAFQLPAGFVAMPPVATSDAAAMGVKALTRQVREAALQLRVEHQPFWLAAFARMRELRDQIGLVEAARFLVAFARLRSVDEELVDHCEQLLATADGEALLELQASELAQVAEALGAMQRPVAFSAVVAPLVSRAHRLPPEALAGLLRAAASAGVGAAGTGELVDAACKAVVERGDVNADALRELADAAITLAAAGQYNMGQRTGLELLFRHVARHAREAPAHFAPHASGLVEAVHATGYATPTLRRLLGARQGTEADVPGPPSST